MVKSINFKDEIMKNKIILLLLQIIGSTQLFGQLSTQGSEVLINTTTTNTQQNPAIAMDNNGNYVVVWESYGTDGDGFGIYAQRFNHLGVAIGTEFLVNTTTASNQSFPDVAMDGNGNFIVVWQSDNQDGDGLGIYAARFHHNGTANGSEFQVNSTISGEQRQPSVAMNDIGDFVIAWSGPDLDEYGIFAQLYDHQGTTHGGEISVNMTTLHNQSYADVAINNMGNFTIVWQSYLEDGSGNGIFFQSYEHGGFPLGIPTQVNTTSTDNQQAPAIAMDTTGNFAIVWESYGQDVAHTTGIYAQRYDYEGMTLGSETHINSTSTGFQTEPNIAMDSEGNYIIAWSSYGTDGSFDGVYAQAYKNDGTTLDSETQVNTRTTDFQQRPAIAMNYNLGMIRIVWQDGLENSNATHDGDDYAIAGQGFTVIGVLPVELLFFTGRKQENYSLLEWETATEINNAYFEVEWSVDPDAHEFQKIGTVNGAGTTTISQSYDFLHTTPALGDNYYRLKQVDFDGSYEYSPIVIIHFDDAMASSPLGGFKFYPNPTTGHITIELPVLWTITTNITIFDATGKLVFQTSTNAHQLNLDIADLTGGTYILRATNDIQTYNQQFIKVE